MMQLKNKVALVTGAGSGIGRAIALGFAEEGATVVGTDIDVPAAERVAADLRGAAIALGCDVADGGQVDAAVATVAERFDWIDVLVNNAGRARGGTGRKDVGRRLGHGVRDERPRHVSVLPRGASSHDLAAVRRHHQYRVWTGIRPRPYVAAHAASKAAVISFTETLALEVASYGIRVNAFTPGVMDTPFWRANRTPEEIEEAYTKGEVGQPGDLVPTVVFLASGAAREITGVTIPRQIFVAKEGP